MLVLLWWFSSVIISAQSQFGGFPSPDPSSSKAMERIIHGSVVDISEFPYQVGLVQSRGSRKRIICGGAIVKPNVIFTAAHCTHVSKYEERPNLSVLVGANHLHDSRGRLHEIERVEKHPGFNFRDFDHDFSVLVLSKPIEFDDRAQAIAVSTGRHKGGSIATASGWGQTEYGSPSKYLRAAKLVLEEWAQCQSYFPRVFHPKITKNMICVRPGRKTTYYGDSGGPLVIDGELVGLVSFGRTVKGNHKTTVFTRVKNFLDFAENASSDSGDDKNNNDDDF